MAELKLAVVGAGMIGKRHIDTITASERAQLVAIADPSDEARALCQSKDLAYFADVESLLAHGGIDGAVIATPTIAHLDAALLALNAGVHVLIEKPITATLEQAQRIAAKVSETNRHVLVGHHRRYYPVVERAREMIREGELGALLAVTGQWNMRKDEDYYLPQWRQQRPAGPVLTNLVHDIDMLRYLCGEITHMSAELSNSVRGFEKEDVAALLLRFECGALGTFILSDSTPSPWGWESATGENPRFPRSMQNSFRLMGSQACIEFPNLSKWTFDDSLDADKGCWFDAMQEQKQPLELGDAFARQFDHFCDVLSGTALPRVDVHDGSRSLQACLGVFDAARTGQRIEIHNP